MAKSLQAKLDAAEIIGAENIALTQNMIFNQKLIAFIALSFIAILWIVVFESARKIIKR